MLHPAGFGAPRPVTCSRRLVFGVVLRFSRVFGRRDVYTRAACCWMKCLLLALTWSVHLGFDNDSTLRLYAACSDLFKFGVVVVSPDPSSRPLNGSPPADPMFLFLRLFEIDFFFEATRDVGRVVSAL